MKEIPIISNQNDDEPERMRSQSEVAIRALCLEAFLYRTLVENEFPHADKRGRAILRDKAQKIQLWLVEQELRSHLSSWERPLLYGPTGSWNPREANAAGWRSESLGTLLWALSFLEKIPHFDTQFEYELFDLIDYGKSKEAFLTVVTLRSESELQPKKQVAWSYMMRAYFGQPDLGITISAYDYNGKVLAPIRGISSRSPEELYSKGWIDSMPDGDLPAYGKPFALLSRKEAFSVLLIAQERYFALRWILGDCPDWEDRSLGWGKPNAEEES